MASSTVTVSANGVLNSTNIPWLSVGGNFDPSAGTWVPDDCQVNMTGNYKAIKMGAGQTLYRLQLAGAYYNVTGAANVTNKLTIVGRDASTWYSWLYGSTRIGGYQADANGTIDLGPELMAVQNLYHTDEYPSITSSAVTTGNIYSYYEYQATADETVTWTISSSCSDIDVGASTGLVSGIPLENGDITITITATDSAGGTATQTFTIDMSGGPGNATHILMAFVPIMVMVVILGYLGSTFNSRRKR